MSMIKWWSKKDAREEWSEEVREEWSKEVREERPEEHPLPVKTEDAEIKSPEVKAQYKQCGRCVHMYMWTDISGKERLMCKFLREPVLDSMKAGVWPCGMFEEHLGCMHCEHRVSDPVTLINGDEYVKCERMRATFVSGAEVTIGWERMNTGRKCTFYRRKGGEE